MPFRLKNAETTYPKLVNQMFKGQIEWNIIEVYVDNLFIKSNELGQHTTNLWEAFKVLRKSKMKLNPMKCIFIVSERGIEANLEKIQAIINMKSPKNLNEVQKLEGRIAALNKFIFQVNG